MNDFVFFVFGRMFLRVRLHIARCDNVLDYSGGKRFRFAVVDLDKAKEYPVNFVCLFPLRLNLVDFQKFWR